MGAGVKFLFDEDFSSGAKSRSANVSLAQHEAALAEAEARGHRNGLAAGRAEGAADTQRRLATALAKIGSAMEAMVKTTDAMEARLESEAVELAAAIAGRLAPALIEREPFAEISALASECFRHIVNAPHVVIRVAEELYEDACGRLKQVADTNSFNGRLIVLADAEVAVGDCRIEWADGGANRDRAAIESAIADAVARYVAAVSSRAAAGGARSTAP